ncbi:hypothetical protein QWY31_16155 [Cytophagales bacterium LB-30]|uniref:Uncharacterized protein n=1 Tax=Shiella aurantiaca TaxID=3058365 RepID=A0ABT8F9H3_9BACT|nr:hypothetical protein [Shiella aurantiaca]MDN4167045.1 hypothetical protein [Shiella aurantiaca]
MDMYLRGPEFSQCKLLVYWKVPIKGYEAIVYYSDETRKTIVSNDIRFGLNKLLVLLMEAKRFDMIARAILYHRPTNSELLKVEEAKLSFLAPNLPEEIWKVIIESPLRPLLFEKDG